MGRRLSAPILEAWGLSKHYARPREAIFSRPGTVSALRDVSLAIYSGRSLAIVGESGSGKSTLARLLIGLEPPSSGEVRLFGERFSGIPERERRSMRRRIQMVFQDAGSSLDPRRKIRFVVDEPLRGFGRWDAREREGQTLKALASVGLDKSAMEKYPHQFSGGQRQRIALARALVIEPTIVIADEPLSALDVSVQAQVLNLMIDLKERTLTTFILITHDLGAAAHLCEDVLIMRKGEAVERGNLRQVFDNPTNSYTRQLLEARRALGAALRAI